MLATEELFAEAAQRERLATELLRVSRRVPLYQRANTVTTEDSSLASTLGTFPFITKEDIRHDFPRNFLGTTADLEELISEEVIELEHTSGTSEPRIPLLLPPGWWAEQEARALRLNRIAARVFDDTPNPRRVTISSPVCSGDICFTGVPSHNDRIVGNTLYLSLSRYPFFWSKADLARMATEAKEWQPQFLDLDPVYGVVFATYCEQHGIRLPSLRFILCTYEFLSIVHRRILQRAFGVPAFNLYGSTETGHLLMEDESGQMRASLETAYLEVLDFGRASADKRGRAQDGPGNESHWSDRNAPDETGVKFGELVVTSLTNEFMPLVRYRIDDLAERHSGPYGNRYKLHGRAADAFLLPSGRPVTTLEIDRCFEGISGIAHYQLIERAGAPWLLRYVPDGAGPGQRQIRDLSGRLTEQLALAVPVVLDRTETLLPESSGKFRLGYPSSQTCCCERM